MKERNNDTLMNAPIDCEALRELIPAYSIGATDDDETRLIEAGLRRCPELAVELTQYTSVGDSLAQAVPQLIPPPELLGSLLIAAQQSRSRAQTRRRIPLAWLAAACLALILVASNAYWISRVNSAAVRELTLPTADEGAATGATARVIWSPNTGDAVLLADSFPLLTGDSVYQAWVRRGESVTSAGTFRVDETGTGALTFPADLLALPFEGMGITTEPAGGSPGPTSGAVVRWRPS